MWNKAAMKGSAATITMIVLLVVIVIVLLLGFGFVKLNVPSFLFTGG